MIRRSLDICIALLVLAIVSPVLAIGAALIRRESPGPIFYRARRVGRDGRVFRLWKLRTMVAGADKGSALTGKEDPRITPIGRFLREWKIDEFPQLLNVLKGDMSLVGPRPETPRIVAQYTPGQWQVLSVRPGITGPSQIRWRDEESCFPEGVDTEEYYLREILPHKLQADLDYIRTRSLKTDVYYLWRTGIAVAKVSWSFAAHGAEMIFLLGHRRRLLLLLLDAVLTVASYLLATFLRFEGDVPRADWMLLQRALPVLVAIRVACFLLFGLYRGFWAYASIDDLLAIVKAVSAGSGLFVVSLIFLDLRRLSRTVLVMDWLILVLLIGGTRLSWRMLKTARGARRAGGRPVLIIGAGDAGETVARELRNNPRLKCRPIGFLDDDPAKRGARIHGIPVLGAIEDVGTVAQGRDVDEVIVAIPSADRGTIHRIFELCRGAGVTMKIVPGLGSVLDGTARLSELREIRMEDLLRREPARLEKDLIRAYLRGRRVLVTGAGGSIGSEICRQVAACEPSVLVLLDNGENALFEIDAELVHGFPKLHKAAALADIKHIQRLQEIFAKHRPEIVFDAAAFKHVPLMESHPEEAVLNNVVGTRRLAEVAVAYGTRTFVLISTDKAVNPTSVMGATKRVGERYIQGLNTDPSHGRTVFCAVRFGNVLGSSGSVVPTFRRQIEVGGPITVTHPEVTRYFMTIPEAVQLVLRASTMARGGEIFVLDMGEPVKIADMAHDLIRLSGLEPEKDIEVVFTGLRPGEKLAEELWYAEENVGPTGQDKLLVVRQPANGNFVEFLPQLAELERLAVAGERGLLIHALRRMVPEYQPLGSDFLGQRRVLVVDDDPEMRDVLRGILEDSYEVIQAADAAEAIAKAREELPDLILLDIKLPGVDGYSVCQTLKADPRTQPIPIVMLSALADVEEKVRGIDMGADDYITKPFDVQELRARLQMVLRRASVR